MSCLGPIKCEKPMETKKWEQEYCGRDSFSVMTFNFIGRIDIQLKGMHLKCAGSLACGARSLMTKIRKMLMKNTKLARIQTKPGAM